MSQKENLSGIIEKVSFTNPSNGFTVAQLNDGKRLITVVGNLAGAGVGETVKLTGEHTEHYTFGPQFKVDECERCVPDTAASIYKYLASGGIKGIGPATALRIVNRFGDNTLNVIEKEPQRLAEIKGISHAKAMAISEEYIKNFGVRDLMVYLAQFKVTPDEALRLFKLLGTAAIDKIKLNPYYFCSDDMRFSFERADEIAQAMGYGADFEYRIMCGIEYVLRHNIQNGHTCIPRHKALPVASDLLGVDEKTVSDCCDKMIGQGRITLADIEDVPYLFLPYQYKAESYIATRIKSIAGCPPPSVIDVNRHIAQVQNDLDIEFGALQKRAIELAVNKGMLILTGGPGTGKTTTLNAIIHILEQSGLKILLAAPTGRAAKRMSEVTGNEAKTIHRLLEVEWDESHRPYFSKNERNTLDCHVLIVDEMSMVDSVLFESLLRAVPFGCRLVLVGDSDQLPSVGAGNVLQDLIDSGIIPTVELTEVFRQAMESAIVTNAHKILRGETPDLSLRDSDFFFLKCENAHSVADLVCNLATERLPNAYEYNALEDIQILCPSRKWDAGTLAINTAMQNLVNPPSRDKKEIHVGKFILREGDKVMQIKNNYDITWNKDDGTDGTGIFNGDVGFLESIDMGSGLLHIRFDDKVALYMMEFVDQLELAYAVTVHKSQGSEYECVVMPVSDMPPQLKYRNLLYTGVTRAKNMLVLVGKQQVVEEMTQNVKRTRRYTALRHFLGDSK
ncbi:MAG: ATP-dependent RecD-like DNA helicase [Clostridia bacterium]|nr:ATP-dependent RecD-like DNA helicase [Clostridia bacterium]